MKFEIPALPFKKDALEPHISADTIETHYEKHHKGYLRKLEKKIKETAQAETSLEKLIQEADGDIFNNAAQVWNHTFYWRSMTPGGGGRPSGEMLKEIEKSFQSFESFKQTLAEAAKNEFGSGWAWIVLDDKGRLAIRSTTDAENPLRDRVSPLLALDVWEHAYYLDYRNERETYVQKFIDNLMNWRFVSANLETARKGVMVTAGSAS